MIGRIIWAIRAIDKCTLHITIKQYSIPAKNWNGSKTGNRSYRQHRIYGPIPDLPEFTDNSRLLEKCATIGLVDGEEQLQLFDIYRKNIVGNLLHEQEKVV